MGNYVYTFRKRTNQITVDAFAQPVHAFAYAHKPSRSLNVDPRSAAAQDRQISMAQDAFEMATEVTPDFAPILPLVYVGDKPSEGAPVYVATSAVWNDGCDFPGILIGKMTKVQNRWHVTAQETTTELARAYLTQRA